jgi:hypothetical protein
MASILRAGYGFRDETWLDSNFDVPNPHLLGEPPSDPINDPHWKLRELWWQTTIKLVLNWIDDDRHCHRLYYGEIEHEFEPEACKRNWRSILYDIVNDSESVAEIEVASAKSPSAIYNINLERRGMSPRRFFLRKCAMRQPLGNRRRSEICEIAHNGHHRLSLCIGFYEDGRPGECFVSSPKIGTELEATARDSAILISLLLQNQVALTDIAHSLTVNPNGTPTSIVGTVIEAMLDLNKGK